MGLFARLLSRSAAGFVQQHGGSATLTAPRFPDLPQGYGYVGPDTDPQHWPYGNINVESLTQARHFDVRDTLYRWCGEVVDARTAHALLRFAEEQPEYMKLHLEMYRMGKRVREYVGTELLQELKQEMQRKGDARWRRIPPVFDPDLPLPWSRAHIMRKLCNLKGIDLVRMNETHKQIAAHYSGASAWPVYAFMQMYGPMRAPLIAVDVYPLGFDQGPNSADPLWHDNTNAWTFEAACCFAKWYKDKAVYSGMAAQPEIIAPFDLQAHASLIPLFHVFSKALLRFYQRCPDDWPCYCNQIADFFAFGGDDTPRQETGVLSMRDTAKTEPPTPAYRAGTGGTGFGQAVPLSRSLGQAAPTSRGMTPPAGTYLHEYNRRRNTDPNLRHARRDTDHGLGGGGK